ncbi:hypothetical protein DY000_02043633, partial [Brassica cretica]
MHVAENHILEKAILDMGIQTLIWQVTKKAFTGGIIGLTISDRFCSVVPVRGDSMSPTFNPQRDSYLDDYVLVDKFCLKDYKFARGDVVVFSSPSHYKERYIKRIVGIPGEWISSTEDVIRVPEGNCWVEGDNKASSLDSRTFGPVSPLCSPLTHYFFTDSEHSFGVNSRTGHSCRVASSKTTQTWWIKLLEKEKGET